MPIYEYQCANCGHRLEALQKMSEAPLEKCPQCKAMALKKLISLAAFRLKGGGWYETDFKTDAKRNLVEEKNNSEKDTVNESGKKDSASEDSGKTKEETKVVEEKVGKPVEKKGKSDSQTDETKSKKLNEKSSNKNKSKPPNLGSKK